MGHGKAIAPGQAGNGALDKPKAFRYTPALFSPLGEDLHAEADAEQRFAGGRVGFHRSAKAEAIELLHGAVKGAHAREDNPLAISHGRGIAKENWIVSALVDGIPNGTEIADLEV